MGLTVSMKHPHFDVDKLFGLLGVEMKNDGQPHDVPPDVESSFAAENGVTVQEAFKDHPYITIGGSPSSDVAAPVQAVAEPAPAVNPNEPVQVIGTPSPEEGVNDA